MKIGHIIVSDTGPLITLEKLNSGFLFIKKLGNYKQLYAGLAF